MSLYKVTPTQLEVVKQTSFVDEKLLERQDLQRLLKSDISVIGQHAAFGFLILLF